MTRTATARALLFDMDGTVLDSTPVVERLWTQLCERFGIDPASVLPHIHGVRAIDSIRRFLPADADHETLAAELAARERTELDGVVAIPGAHALLTALPAGSLALVTSATEPLMHARMAAAGLPIPGVVVTAEQVERGKPDPQGYRDAARILGVSPEDAIVFEDAPAGLAAAAAAGMRSVAIGSFSPEHPAPSSPIAELVNYRDLGLEIADDGWMSLRF